MEQQETRGDAAPCAAPCPGSSNAIAWDEGHALRGDIWTGDRIEAHAAEIAATQGDPVIDRTPGPLRDRFVESRQRIREAYAILRRRAPHKRELSAVEEWLLDNSHVVEEQLREIEEDLPAGYLVTLPRLASGRMAGHPCVYGLCVDYLRHSEARLDIDALVRYVRACQGVRTLTIGELWAIPIMLRIGLVLTVGAIAAEAADDDHRVRGDAIADRLLAPLDTSEGAAAVELFEQGHGDPSAPLLVHLQRRLREHEAPSGAAFDWIRAECAKLGLSPDELTRRHHLKQAADQVCIGNAITSMRAIAALDWNKFFEKVSAVEEILRRDPARAYEKTHRSSRDRYRHAVEDVARRGEVDECTVAELAVELAADVANARNDGTAAAHVGHWLVGDGRTELERRVGYRAPLRQRVQRFAMRHPTASYLGPISVVTVILAVAFAAAATASRAGPLATVGVALLALLPASEVAVALTHAMVTWLLPPRLLAKLELAEGIPEDSRTLVVVPVLLDSEAGVDRMLEDLEIRHLANGDHALAFALLTDFVDHVEETHADDVRLLARVKRGIAELNEKYPRAGEPAFHLFHRRRRHNAAQGCWMGWERKRGKLEELNRLLRGEADGSFDLVTASESWLRSVRYVLTLDADTELPRDVARDLVATISHPLNRPRIDAATGRIVEGYGIIQPRVGTEPVSARKSLFARVMAGPAGIDPYTTAVSDVYQDLFGEGSYVGKAIYDVEAFSSALADRVPENALLSHDLFEGLHARTALATDIELLDDQPSSYAVAANRYHRWVRGDWQLAPWLGARPPRRAGANAPNDLSVIGRWKLFDNLRRSVVPFAIVLVLAWGWAFGAARLAMMLAAAALATPLVAGLMVSLARPEDERSPRIFTSLWGDLRTNAAKLVVQTVFLLDHAVLAVDAIGRTLHRVFVSRRYLLSWQTMKEVEGRAAKRPRSMEPRMVVESGLVFAFGLGLFAGRGAWLPALPVLALWVAAPVVAARLSAPWRVRERASLEPGEHRMLRLVARKTWSFFETFVTAEDHHLPPDNYQEEPRGIVAHRTSPTNIGLYLLSVTAARDFGFIGPREVVARIGATLATLGALEKNRGHILNWYDTTTLAPLEPRYVSTVDSGNLAAYLGTLRTALEEQKTTPIVGASTFEAMLDALELFERAGVATALLDREPAPESIRLRRAIAEARAAGPRGLGEALATLRALEDLASAAVGPLREREGEPSRPSVDWQAEVKRSASRWIEELVAFAPWAPLLERVPRALSEGALADGWIGVTRGLAGASTIAALAQTMRALSSDLRVLERRAREQGDAAGEPASEIVAFLAELREQVARSHDECLRVEAELDRLAGTSVGLADGMDFRFLYDRDRALFAIGYDVSGSRLDRSYYDLLASEARLASLLAIARGQVPEEHWFRIGRPRAALPSGRVLLSWSGSMFEYLMPLLVTRSYEATLLAETCESAVLGQVDYANERGVPWGMSESAYNTMDLSMTYQYRAFGVPWLGFKPGLTDDVVVAPYATMLASLVRPDLVGENLVRLAKEGVEGPFGFYESIDYTPAHVPPGRRGVVVKAFMAHHQGMGLVALDNALHGAPMQRRFHADPRIRASELLLEERVPVGAPLVERHEVVSAPAHSTADVVDDGVEHVGLGASAPLRIHLLGHGELSSLVSAAGTGVTTWRGLDLHRYREDPVLDPHGIFVYLRDLDGGRVWSAGHQPTRAPADHYQVRFDVDKVEIHRRDGEIETVMEIGVSPEHPAEVRRVTLVNHGSSPRRLELTTYTEVVLAPRNADVAHRAFSSMFVETDEVPNAHAMLAHRRPRSPDESEAWLVQVLTSEHGPWDGFQWESSRAAFIGRGRSLEHPAALEGDSPLGGARGEVLDPAMALRRTIVLEPGGRARIALTTALASSRKAALALIETYGSSESIERTFELGWADARVELKHLGMNGVQATRSQRLLSAILSPQPGLRAAPAPERVKGACKDALWAHGISGDVPILLLRVDEPEVDHLLREILMAHEFWRINGIPIDFVILNEEATSYEQPLQRKILSLIAASPARSRLDQRGGIYVVRGDQLSAEHKTLMACAARVVLVVSMGSLGRQLRRGVPPAEEYSSGVEFPPRRGPRATTAPARPELAFDNGFGGFSRDAREYVMVVSERDPTPAPWCNVMANPSFGCLVSERGAGFTWAYNSQSHRLTPWSNDAVCDPPGESVYVRDDETGEIWSAAPAPAPGGASYLVRHGQGYSIFEHERGGLAHELTVFVDPREPVKISRLRVVNRGDVARRISVTGVVEWVLGSSRERSRLTVVTQIDADRSTIVAFNPSAVLPERRAFFAASAAVAGATADREEFFGQNGSRVRPRGLERAELGGRAGAGRDPCGALLVRANIPPGETFEISFVLGEADDDERARALAIEFTQAGRAARSLEAARGDWERRLGTVTVETPDPALDAMANRWLLYQSTSSRVWARSAFYQSGGAFGFRDQLQDVLAMMMSAPEIARAHLLTSAARQFLEGDVQHWWHPETGEGVRTRCSDDMLWLPYVAAEYVLATGDAAVLDEEVPFIEERLLREDEHDLFRAPAVSPTRATLYEHCLCAIRAGSTAGEHGLPLMRAGDWNDGMNRVGVGGKGESVWLAWFLAATIERFSRIARSRGDLENADAFEREARRLGSAVDAYAWDGEWYVRAYFDDGSPVGSSRASECKIDAIAQSWAVISGAGDQARARRANRNAEELLVGDGIMRLFTPPFRGAGPDPGYIRAYPPGVRENGGQYTHGVLWTALAETMLGDGERAVSLLTTLNPVRHALTREDCVRYAVEPYVVAADVYGVGGLTGRGGWTWYTGSAAWMYRIIVEHVLGLRLVGGKIAVVPCIPPGWRSYEMRVRRGDTLLHVRVENPEGVSTGRCSTSLDGRPVPDGLIDVSDGREHLVVVTLSGGEKARSAVPLKARLVERS